MDARRRRLALVAAVPASSVLGLALAMLNGGVQVFGAVWSANLWGDLLFVGGTVGSLRLVEHFVAQWPTGRKGRIGRVVVAVALSLGLHAFVYGFAAWQTLAAMDGDDGFLAFNGRLADLPLAGYVALIWGWVGLAAMALLTPWFAWACQRADGRGDVP